MALLESLLNAVLGWVGKRRESADARSARTYEKRREAYDRANTLLSDMRASLENAPLSAKNAHQVEQRYPPTPPRDITNALDLDAPENVAIAFGEAYGALRSALAQWSVVATIRHSADERDLWTVLHETHSDATQVFEQRWQVAIDSYDGYKRLMRQDLRS